MSIPLDRLYHFLEDLCGEDIVIYRWYPHGSKKLSDLTFLNDAHADLPMFESITRPTMIFHDQEPLDYHLYTHDEFLNDVKQQAEKRKLLKPRADWCYSNEFMSEYARSHLRTKLYYPFNLYDLILLVHSEKNSEQLKLYEQNGFVGIYYWSHAVIARDWFRYAEVDNQLIFDPNNVVYDFLIYNRAWQGSREYRLKFAEMILDCDLLDKSFIKFNPIDDAVHYTQHNFKNPSLAISRHDLEHVLPQNISSSHFSADYDSADYKSCAIEVVLETLFDDTRNHLTEKTLRPIACGKPFILASSPNSLLYLRDYGFKTFDGLINERYDTILNPLERLQEILKEMHRLSSLPVDEKKNLWTELHKIAKYNKDHFFSDKFHQQIVDEFVCNFNQATKICKDNANGKWWNFFTKNPMFETVVTDFSLKVDQYLEDLNKLHK